jgi:hypothetical protein
MWGLVEQMLAATAIGICVVFLEVILSLSHSHDWVLTL